jgi:hypothetical protein
LRYTVQHFLDLSEFYSEPYVEPAAADAQTTGASPSNPLNETSLAATRELEVSEAAGGVIGRYRLPTE